MTITFIHHSSFLVELSHMTVLFDYTEGALPDIDPKKPLVIFASHAHGDHFSPVIFRLLDRAQEVRFVLSDDIPKRKVPEELLSRTTFVKKDQVCQILGEVYSHSMHAHAGGADGVWAAAEGSLTVRTFDSTDQGVAFLLNAEGHLLYHAGDLNDWVWEGEPEEDNRAMHDRYLRDLSDIAKAVQAYDARKRHSGSHAADNHAADNHAADNHAADSRSLAADGEAFRTEAFRTETLRTEAFRTEAGQQIEAAFVPLDPRLEREFSLGIDEFMRIVGAQKVYPMHFWGDFGVTKRFLALPCTEGYRDRIVDIRRDGERFC